MKCFSPFRLDKELNDVGGFDECFRIYQESINSKKSEKSTPLQKRRISSTNDIKKVFVVNTMIVVNKNYCLYLICIKTTNLHFENALILCCMHRDVNCSLVFFFAKKTKTCFLYSDCLYFNCLESLV